ncbi:MAG: hypothetical protein Q7S76_02095, partial [bacterium]|nr:hypothetical protein [bacterium]
MDILGLIGERALPQLSKDLAPLFLDGAPRFKDCPDAIELRHTNIGHLLARYPREAETRTKMYRALAKQDLLYQTGVSIPPNEVGNVEHLCIAQLEGGKLGKGYWSWGIKEIPAVIEFAKAQNIRGGNIVTIHNHPTGSDLFSNGDYRVYLK